MGAGTRRTLEWEIVELLGEGATTEQIAEQLVLSTTTIYSHIKSLLRKLGVHSRREAVAVAERLRREEAVGTKPPNPVRGRGAESGSGRRTMRRAASGRSW